MVFKVIGYEPNAECLGCEREKECLVIETEGYRGPHCAKCLMREGKKRGRTQRQPNAAENASADCGRLPATAGADAHVLGSAYFRRRREPVGRELCHATLS
jgi:hypothetical protein